MTIQEAEEKLLKGIPTLECIGKEETPNYYVITLGDASRGVPLDSTYMVDKETGSVIFFDPEVYINDRNS